MASVRQVIDGARQYLEDAGGRPSSDTFIPNKYLYYLINIVRNALYMKYYRNEFNVPEALTMDLECVELEKVDAVEGLTAPPTGVKFARTKVPIPEMLNQLPISVKDVDPISGEVYDYQDYSMLRYKPKSRIKPERKGKYYSLRKIDGDTYLYIYNAPNRMAVTMSLIPDDPMDAYFYEGVCGEVDEYEPLDKSYVVSEEQLTEIYSIVYDIIAKGKSISRAQDVLNDDKQDNVPSATNQGQ